MFAELALCIAGIYACFLTWQLTQERVTTTTYTGGRFRYFVFLNMVQSLIASLVASVYSKLRGEPLTLPSAHLLNSYFRLSVLSTLAPNFGYASLKHVDFPTMILGKSCKLVPVMLMNFIIYRRTFPPHKYLCVGLITLGVSSFMLLHKQESDEGHGKPKGAGSNSLYGLALLSINLLLDGAMNSVQDQLFKKDKVSSSSMMVYMNLFSTALMAGYLLLNPFTTELSTAMAFCAAHPQVIGDIMLFAVCGAVGQCFIFHTLERFGAVSLVTVTVTRKMFSILLSIFWFDHDLSLGQWGAVGLVFSGIGLEAYMKRVQDAVGRGKRKGEANGKPGQLLNGEGGRNGGNGADGEKEKQDLGSRTSSKAYQN
ncbi:UDP-galactose transporter [Borealophlyctis nickersoniae]|nr:UDP-galactose transporter [Borealophlyctis nickersoniae]